MPLPAVRRARPVPAAAGALIFLSLTGLTSAAPALALPSSTVFFSDSRTLAPAQDDLGTLRRLKPLACAVAPAAPEIRDLPAALDRIQTYLGAHESRAALAGLGARPELKNTLQAQGLAAAAVTADRPTAALVALLAAHARTPADPVPLVNAAGVLNTLALYREALALLDAADRTKGDFGHPLGWSGQAVALNNRGYALTGLGRYPQAEQALRQAARLEPRLAEANTNLARTLSCEGKEGEALKFLRLGQRRSPPGSADKGNADKGDIVTDGPTGPGTDAPDKRDDASLRRPAAGSFDLSAGHEGTLPDLDVPQTPEEAVANLDVYQAALKEYEARIAATNASILAVQSRLRARRVNPATEQRTTDLLNALSTVDAEPGIRALRDRVDRSAQDAADLWGAFFTGEGGAATLTKLSDEASKAPNYDEAMRALCVPALHTMHDRWRTVTEGLIVDTRRYYKATSRIESGLAANLSDPDEHALAVLNMASAADSLYYSGIVTGFATLARQEQIAQDHCLQQPGAAAPSAKILAPKTEAPASCPAILKGVKLAFKFSELLQASVNCEAIEAKLASGSVGVFGSFKVSGAAFTTSTLMIGIQAGADLPGTKTGGSVSEGLFLKFGPGGLQDGGLKIDAKGTLGLKGGVYTATGETKGGVTFAVVSGFSYY